MTAGGLSWVWAVRTTGRSGIGCYILHRNKIFIRHNCEDKNPAKLLGKHVFHFEQIQVDSKNNSQVIIPLAENCASPF